MSQAAVAVCKTTDLEIKDQTLQWLALTLTPGLGATRSRRLAELFGGVQGIFRASLTELEAAGLTAVSAQSLGTGQSLELAKEESQKAKEAGITIISLDDSAYPPNLKQITIRQLCSMFADAWTSCLSLELLWSAHAFPLRMAGEWQRNWPVNWLLAAW